VARAARQAGLRACRTGSWQAMGSAVRGPRAPAAALIPAGRATSRHRPR